MLSKGLFSPPSFEFVVYKDTPTTLTVTVRITNFLKLTSNATAHMTIEVAALPTATIAGPLLLTVDRSQTVDIQSIGTAPDCGIDQSKTDALVFSWHVVPHVRAIQYLSDPRLIQLKPNVLAVGEQYTVTVTVASKKVPSLYNTAEVVVQVVQQALVAVINQGENIQTVSAEEDLIVTGTNSDDPDTTTGNNQHLMFAWHCTTLTLSNNNQWNQWNNQQITVQSKWLVPGTTHRIVLNVTDSNHKARAPAGKDVVVCCFLSPCLLASFLPCSTEWCLTSYLFLKMLRIP